MAIIVVVVGIGRIHPIALRQQDSFEEL